MGEQGEQVYICMCTKQDIYPWDLDEEDRAYIAEAEARAERLRNTPRCPICGEGPQFFKDGVCPYINDEDHQQTKGATSEQKSG